METYDPYEEVPRPSIGLFAGLPSAGPGTVLVVDREGKPLRALLSHTDRLTAGEARFGRIRTVYRVIVARRVLAVPASFPCRDAGAFTADLRLTCQVVDPVDVVVRGVHDVAAVLVPRVTETLRVVCRGFAAEDYAEAETAALTAVRELEAGPRHDKAFRITDIALTLTLDADADAFVRELKRHTRSGVLVESETSLEILRAQQEAALAKQRQELEAQQAALQANLDLERLKLQQEREQQEAALARARMVQEETLENERMKLQLEREELAARSRLAIERERAEQYGRMLAQGEYAVLAMQITHDPAAIDRVAVQLAQRQTAEATQQLRALQLFLEHDALEAMDIGDQAKVLLKRLADGWARGMPQLPALPDGDEVVALPGTEAMSGAERPSGASEGPA